MAERSEAASRGVEEGRVKRYIDFWVVVGEEEYVVIGPFCTCPDYLYNVSSKNPTADRCWHSLAVEEARETGGYDEVHAHYHHLTDL